MTVPDQKASAEWYGRIFDPQLFQERDPPPRYYVRMGTAYIAFGGTPAADPTPKIDHFCALVKGYKPDEMRAAVEKAGISMGTGRLGMPTDADGIRLQLLGVPGGLARTIIPSTRITTDDAAVAPVGLDHIVLAVSDVDRASSHYAKFFGPPTAKKPARSGSRSRTHALHWSRLRPAASPRSSGFASASPASTEKPLRRSCRSSRWKPLRHAIMLYASETRTDSPSN